METGGLLAVSYEAGPVATIDCSWDRPANYPTWGGLQLEVLGTRGSVAVDAFSQVVTHYDGARRTLRSLSWGPNLDRLLLETFVDAVRAGEGSPQPDGEAGRRALAVALAAYRSAETGQPAAVEQ